MDASYHTDSGANAADPCPTAQSYAASLEGQICSQRSASQDEQQTRPSTTQCSDQDGTWAESSRTDTGHLQQMATSLGAPAEQQPANSAYLACVQLIRQHQASEAMYNSQLRSRVSINNVDEGFRTTVVSWLVEVAEEFRLQQETLHSILTLLDSFLATATDVPCSVLQLIAVGCVYLASKQLEETPPSVDDLVDIAANSFSAEDLLRIERVLLKELDFHTTPPTAYGYLKLLTQATLAVSSSSSIAALEIISSLATYLVELAILNQPMTNISGSQLATAATLLAHATISGGCSAWPTVLDSSGMLEADVTHVITLLSHLHAAAWYPSSARSQELLLPLRFKFGRACWCNVAEDVVPYMIQQQQ